GLELPFRHFPGSQLATSATIWCWCTAGKRLRSFDSSASPAGGLFPGIRIGASAKTITRRNESLQIFYEVSWIAGLTISGCEGPMYRKNHSLLFLASFLFLSLMIAGCGGNIKTTTPNPTGFTNADLNGTYAFAISGNDGGGFFAIAGSFTANGNGAITGGTEDINYPGASGGFKNGAISGKDTVRTDGRTGATHTSHSPAR